MTDLENKRKERRKQTAECFTPYELVNEMLEKLPPEVWSSEKTFIDNSAGNGAFLVEVLTRKINLNHPPLQALSTIFGVELMKDNVEEMKQRLLNLIPPEFHEEAIKILNHNIVCADALTFDYENWRKPKKMKAKSLF